MNFLFYITGSLTVANVCVSEVKATSASLPRAAFSDQPLRNASLMSYGRRSDPYMYRDGTGVGSSLAVSSQQLRIHRGSSVALQCSGSAVTSSVSNGQRSSDAIASGLAFLRGTAQQSFGTYDWH